MNKIPNIELSEKQVYELLGKNKVFSGGEAVICESNSPFSLYKIFYDHERILPIGVNKLEKINELYRKQLDYSVKPLATISLNDVIIGYEMSSDFQLESYKLYQLSEDELLYFLKQTKYILEYFSNQGIIYGDIDPRNILFNRKTGEIQFCDMDNIQIGDYPMDKIPCGLTHYNLVRGIDAGVHSFMHNIMTLRAFDLDIHYSDSRKIRKLFNPPVKKIILSMREPEKFNNEYIVSRLRKYK